MEAQVIFRGSPKKAVTILVISIGFVILGAWLTTERPLLGWVSIFGLGIPASLLMMLQGDAQLVLAEMPCRYCGRAY